MTEKSTLEIEHLPVNAVMVDSHGVIVAVNQNWMNFGQENGLSLADYGIGTQYSNHFRGHDAERLGRRFGHLLAGRLPVFGHFYVCDTPARTKWFFLIARSRGSAGAALYHIDITDFFCAIPTEALSAASMNESLSDELLEGIARVVEASVARAIAKPDGAHLAVAPVPAASAIGTPLSTLSARQREVLTLIAKGKSNLEIASALAASVNTVKLHVSAVLRRLNVRSRTQAAVYFMREVGAAEPANKEGGDAPRMTAR